MPEVPIAERQLVAKLSFIADGLENPTGANQYRQRLHEMVSTPEGRADVRRALQFFSAERRLLIDRCIPDGVTITKPAPADTGDDEASVTLAEPK